MRTKKFSILKHLFVLKAKALKKKTNLKSSVHFLVSVSAVTSVLHWLLKTLDQRTNPSELKSPNTLS